MYEITRTKARHRRFRELNLATTAQSLQMLSDGRLCVGYQSGFSVYSIFGDQNPTSKRNYAITLTEILLIFYLYFFSFNSS